MRTALPHALGFVVLVLLGTGSVDPIALLAAVAAAGAALAASAQVRERLLVVAGTTVAPHPPLEHVELPVVVTQSRPDAPGRPAPRAPGRIRSSR
ncbi:hypothetical protein HQQ80_13830 [Microbacteriaceae bacterium VKM Ac-2855]|nr:hypothetical protein [Microbacteriaceae bacterium VKM Ac-2855]